MDQFALIVDGGHCHEKLADSDRLVRGSTVPAIFEAQGDNELPFVTDLFAAGSNILGCFNGSGRFSNFASWEVCSIGDRVSCA